MWYSSAILLILAAATVYGQVNVEEQHVGFFLTSPLDPIDREIRIGQENIVIDPSRDVKILVNGWLQLVSNFWYADARTEYLRIGTSNVISVDWAFHSNQVYPIATSATSGVAYWIALLVLDLHDRFNIPLSRFHVIGHSLGAHIGGFVGQHIRTLRPGPLLGRVTGLDPAGTDYDIAPRDGRLSDDDAVFVDVMHTDAGMSGIISSIGHIDYWPNGGIAPQPGCVIPFCGHNRAPVYFVESIWRDAFVATRCTNWALYLLGFCNNNPRTIMGERVSQSSRGDYLLNTASSAPFGLGS